MKKYSSSGSDEGGCLNAGFAKRIISKTSLKSTSSTGKSGEAARVEELSKLQTEIHNLKHSIEHLNYVIDDKDTAIGNLAREKEKLYVELKKVQRTNRNIHQQLEDERDFYQKEKEHYCQEIISLKRCMRRDDHQNYDAGRIKELEKEVVQYQECLEQKDKIIYNLCVKYLRIKSSKAVLRSKMEKLNTQHHQAFDYIVSLLDASRSEMDKLLGDKMKAPATSVASKKYLNLVRRNARLHYENTQLKIRLAALSQDKPQLNDDDVQIRKTKKSKSDGRVPEKNWGIKSLVTVKRSVYTHSNGETDVPGLCVPRIADKVYNPVMFDYSRIAVRRPSSDPG